MNESANGNGTPAPVLVLGLGNPLLGDDGAGLRLLSTLAEDSGARSGLVEFLDGGTQGLALLPYLADRTALLILDTIGLGEPAGTVHLLRGAAVDTFRARRSGTAHEGSALELLELARVLGYEWEDVAVVGVEPLRVRTGIGLTAEIEAVLGEAAGVARRVLEEMVEHVPCNSR
jgi:hydrogenase maturation protease